ncbi:suppressor of variegation 3-9 [Arctopsyche grandis]|uniref:suppressor of variegation 3-9 n=1 Tax=Arctopsyche grandis TaxID=121162 RepID=UPI00406D9DBA
MLMTKRQPKTKKRKREREYIVEKILDVKFEDEILLFVKWKGWSSSDNTWEPLEHLQNCPHLIRNFLNNETLNKKILLEDLQAELTKPDYFLETNMEKYWKIGGKLSDCRVQVTMLLLAFLNLTEHEARNLIMLEIQESIQTMLAVEARENQLKQLEIWEYNINSLDEKIVITVQNNVDLMGPPENFEYVQKNKVHRDVQLPEINPMYCECDDCNVSSKCPCAMYGGFFPYNSKGRLRIDIGTPIFECNVQCRCSSECGNRVVQNGNSKRLCIFRTPNGRGWGVKTLQRIPKGQFVCSYVGELITSKEADARGKIYDAQNRTYLFDLDFNCDDAIYSLDAARFGNISHFINHSCDPNLAVWAVWCEYLDPNLHMLALFSIKDIEKDTEICFDYMQSFNESASSNDNKFDSPIEINKSDEDEVSPIDETMEFSSSPSKLNYKRMEKGSSGQKKLTECKCGSSNCRKFLFN